jgi:hypothetical protein
MANWNTAGKNGQWRGGRVVASNGYVLVRVGTSHHLADVRGYAYEHRLVAERKLGRRLLPGEIPHHLDGDRQNNRPDNLAVVPSPRHHRAAHRKRHDLRAPDDPNPLVACACGCGARFPRYDPLNRPRRFLPGHNPHPRPTLDAILRALRQGPLSRADVITLSGCTVHATAVALNKLRRHGWVRRLRWGVWALVELPAEAPDGR